MRNRFLFLLNPLVISVVSFAQISELDITNSGVSQKARGIEKARNYFNNGQYIRAEAMLYSELEKGNFTPNDFLLFANTLNIDNKPGLAKEFYTEYAKASGKLNAASQIESLFSTTKSSYDSNPVVTDFPITNPTQYNGSVYSSIGGKLMSYEKDCDDNLSNRKEVLKEITNKNFGSIAFYDNGTKAVASLIENNTSSLYLIYQKKGKWKKPKKLFSDVSGNYAFPFIDEANNTLYFSSDRANGFGGYDIYLSSISDKSFSSPINMGNQINSLGNEINPTVTNDWLYLSSNGHISKGGYDLFKYKNLGDFNIIFANCTELNTTANDLSIVPTGKNQFLVSRGNNDGVSLYSLSRAPVVVSLSGTVLDEDDKPIKNAFVFLGANNGMGKYSVTNTAGNFIYRSGQEVTSYTGKVMADGFESTTFTATADVPPIVKLTKIKPIEIIKEVEKTVYSNNPSVDYSSSIVTAPTVGTEVEQDITEVIIPENSVETSANSARPDRGLYYIVIGSTYNYAQAYDFWNKWISSFSGAEILEYDNGLYRIGFYAGTDENQAMSSFNEARKLKKDIWILRPKN